MKWVVKLSEYDTQYVPRVSVKGQAAADFVAQLTLAQLKDDVNPG